MTEGIDIEYTKARENNNSIFALSVMTLQGPGTVWIDTAPIQRIIDEIDGRLPHKSYSTHKSCCCLPEYAC
jgi:uncharacterized protein (AIM24 family)